MACQWGSLLQQATGLPDRRGTSCQRQPLRSPGKIPFTVRQSSALGRPRRCAGGNSGRGSFHRASVNAPFMANPPYGDIGYSLRFVKLLLRPPKLSRSLHIDSAIIHANGVDPTEEQKSAFLVKDM